MIIAYVTPVTLAYRTITPKRAAGAPGRLAEPRSSLLNGLFPTARDSAAEGNLADRPRPG
jgi:hypothetical protein